MSPITLFLDFCAVAAGLTVILVTLGVTGFLFVCWIGSRQRKVDDL